MRHTSRAPCGGGGGGQQVSALLLLVLAAWTAAAAAQGLPITHCQELIAWSGQQFPPAGTTFCPTDAAFDWYARISGFRSWSAMFAAVQAAPDRWSRYMQRIANYHTSTQYLPLADVPAPNVKLDSKLPSAFDPNGLPTAYSQLTLERWPAAGGGARITLLPPGRARLTILSADARNDGAGVVHVINTVLWPPNTFPTLKDAFFKRRDLLRTSSYARTLNRTAIYNANTTWTLFAPTDTAWHYMDLLRGQKPAPWAGNISTTTMRASRPLTEAIWRYLVVEMPYGGATDPLSYESMLRTWRLGTPGQPQNFIALPTLLWVGRERQWSMYTYDPIFDSIYLVGGRNEMAAPYMAGAEVAKQAIYAGCSTIIPLSGSVPLPLLTGVRGFDSW